MIISQPHVWSLFFLFLIGEGGCWIPTVWRKCSPTRESFLPLSEVKQSHCLAKRRKKKRHGLEQRLWICLYEPALSPAFCYISVNQVWTNCSTGGGETIPGPSSKTLQMALATWLLGFVQPWVTATLFPVMNWWHCTDLWSAAIIYSRPFQQERFSVFYLYFMCVCLVCNCFWFSLNKLQLPSLQGILRRIGHSIKIATSNLWALYYCKIISLQPL